MSRDSLRVKRRSVNDHVRSWSWAGRTKMIGLLGMRGVKAFAGAAASALLLVCMGSTPVLADTIEAALVRAYQNNPQLNAQRAQVRVTDENVPQALSGYRPKVAVTASAGYQYSDSLTQTGDLNVGRPPQLTAPTRRAASARPSRRRSSTASRPRTGPERPRGRFPARAKPCAHSNRPSCSAAPRSTWTICAIRRSSRCRRATFACSSRR